MDQQAETYDNRGHRVREYARHAIGSETIYKHWLGLRYTDGIKFLAETCGAYWLIDAVASHQPMISESFQVWRLAPCLSKGRQRWALEAWSDTPDKSKRLARQVIEYTDFPKDLMPFEWWVEHGTMLMKEER